MKYVVACWVVMSGAAYGHGTIPTSNSICFLPDGSLFLGTNFGGIHRVAGGDELVCETSVTGTQQALDAWRILSDGRVVSVATSGEFMRGVYLSGTDGCGFGVVDGTADLLVAGLEGEGERFWVAGQRAPCEACAEEGVVMRGDAAGVDVRATGAAGHRATGVVVGAGERVAVFSGVGAAEVVRLGETVQRVEVTLAVGESLVPLGIAERGGGIGGNGEVDVYFVRRSDTGDVIAMSPDFGASLVEVGRVVGRVTGFASGGGNVWVQSPQVGVMKRAGGPFEEIIGSPHGGCLHWNGRLWACGVPWQDGFALGVSDDGGSSFEAVMPFYDAVARARRCEATTAVCDEELAFLRGYYGFSDPNVVEPGPEPVENVEPGPEPAEATAEVADMVEDADTAKAPEDGGCTSGGAVWWSILGLGLASTRVRRRR